MRSKNLWLICAMAPALFGIQGCRNRIELIQESGTEYRRAEQTPVYTVTLSENEPAGSSIFLKVEKQVRTAVDVVRIDKTHEKYTPYQGWREFYEVPTGLVLLPVALTSHVFCICTFGMFPFRWAVGLTDFSFSCMNPAINAEMESRSVIEHLETVENRLDTTQEESKTPAPGVPLRLRSGPNAWDAQTDDQGMAEFCFIDLAGTVLLGRSDREVNVYVGDNAEILGRFIISRDLLRRLENARSILTGYRENPTGANLAAAIARLEDLKFVKLALELEKTELEAHRDDPQFKQEFEQK